MNNESLIDLYRTCGELTIYIMGGSFIFGSLLTILLLLVLDMLRASRSSDASDE